MSKMSFVFGILTGILIGQYILYIPFKSRWGKMKEMSLSKDDLACTKLIKTLYKATKRGFELPFKWKPFDEGGFLYKVEDSATEPAVVTITIVSEEKLKSYLIYKYAHVGEK